ncbi:cell wall hydrolase [Xanthobacter autotrophicus DSM 431]|uniref:cell wall hydrolase n=1 Tax=Xanthobacter nonsaccharivorans TaxID=3119912 RepID=UPI0037271423
MDFRRNRGRGLKRLASPFLLAAAFAAAPFGGAGADGTVTRTTLSASIGVLGGPMRALKVATLDLPQPIGTQVPEEALTVRAIAVAAADPDRESAEFAIARASGPLSPEETWDFGPFHPASGEAQVELALDLVLALPGGSGSGALAEEGATFGPDLGEPAAEMLAALGAPRRASDEGTFFLDPAILFSLDMRLFRPDGLDGGQGGSAGTLQLVSLSLDTAAADAEEGADTEGDGIVWPTPARRLNLAGEQLARAQKCLAEAIYFESRGEPKRGQVAVAQVIVNRVFSGYYPADVCGAVYQNAHRHLACQFTFACDGIRDVIREPDMWVQAKEIAADMLDGKLWLASIGRATHYHAYWVHPSWVREMRKLDRIGVHTFYRPRRWGDAEVGG